MHRFRMLGGIFAVVIALSFALGPIGTSAGSALGAATTLSVLGGDVYVKHADARTFDLAVDGEIVARGDTVRTGADARAVITYFEGSSVIIDPDTLLVVDTAEPVDGGTVVLMRQLAGRTWHVVTKLVNALSRYEVHTPSSTASVRGTRFSVDARPDRTTITTTEGKVVAAVPAPSGVVEVPVRAGMTQTQVRGSAPAPARPTGSTPGAEATGHGAPRLGDPPSATERRGTEPAVEAWQDGRLGTRGDTTPTRRGDDPGARTPRELPADDHRGERGHAARGGPLKD
jgi:hypothetical protein